MFGVGPLEFGVILVLALIVFGPAKLPELMGSVGRTIREFQRASAELTEVFQEAQQEFTSAVDLSDVVEQEAPVAAEYATNGHAEASEVAATTPIETWVPATTAPAELETAAAMIDPVAPFPEPPAPPPAPVEAATAPSELDTAAGLVDAPPPFEVSFDAPPVPETIVVAASEPEAAATDNAEPAEKPKRARRPRATAAAAGADETA
jgi:TatA/E family protein of Tat protein translocase